MVRHHWFGYTVEVDEPATRDYYIKAPDWDCICGHCRNFLALARARQLPGEVLGILDALHIPPEKATYVCELYHTEDWREKGLIYEFSWRLAGRILDKPAGEDSGPSWGPVVKFPTGDMMLGHETCPVASGFPAPHFDLECVMALPWVLDEPIDGPNEE